jgi:hypothetical protein
MFPHSAGKASCWIFSLRRTGVISVETDRTGLIMRSEYFSFQQRTSLWMVKNAIETL